MGIEEDDTVENLSPEQKDALLEAAFLPNGDHPLPKAGTPPVRTVQEHVEIAQDIDRLNPKGPAAGTISESPLHAANNKLVGPPTVAPVESRVTSTRFDGSSDNTPPARR